MRATDGVADSSAYPAEGSSATMWGVGITQSIDQAAMDLYMNYHHYEAQRLGTEAAPADVFIAGSRITF